MSSEREAKRLRDIVENIDRIESHVAELDFEGLSADQKTIDAVERCLQRITEAAIKIGADRMATISPTTSADAVRGMGNALRHDYDLIDARIIWNTVKLDLPGLRADCLIALANFPTE